MVRAFDKKNIYIIKNNKEFIFHDRLKQAMPKVEYLQILGSTYESDLDNIAVVGSRKMTQYGKEVTRFFVSKLSEVFTIVSGLMYGIDIEAHKVALDYGGRTIGVLGYGFNYLEKSSYTMPVIQEILAKDRGAVFSEFNENHPPDKWTFPKRNRIVASISKAVLIIEADENSGSLITADMALEMGKDVFVVPGSIFSDLSRGKHRLIKEGAILVQNPDDILEFYGLKTALRKTTCAPVSFESVVLNHLKSGVCLDDLVNVTKMPSAKISEIITDLEIEGKIKRIGGNQFVCV